MSLLRTGQLVLGVGVIVLSLSTPARARERPRYALVPLQPVAESTSAYAASLTQSLRTKLRGQGASVAPQPAVLRAMRKLGLTGGQGDAAQWSALGKEVGAARVLVGRVRIQAMVRARGDVWELLDQYDVARGEAFGRFKRVSAFGRAHGLLLLPQFVRRVLAYEGDKPLAMKAPAPMRAPEDAPRVESMAYVPAGEFIMGSERAEIDEEPRRIVYTDAFFIDVHEVTNAQYDKCVGARRCKRATARGNRKLNAPTQPVAGVGYQDAVAYCRFAGKRVLTEAEWEKAARGSDERVYPWGNHWDAKRVNMAHRADGYSHTAPVGSFPGGVSPYGVHDMAGNVWEWTADVYDAQYYRHGPAHNPKGPRDRGTPAAPSRARRVMRGGSWMYDVPAFVTTHNRSPGRPWIRKMFVGIRCGKDAK